MPRRVDGRSVFDLSVSGGTGSLNRTGRKEKTKTRKNEKQGGGPGDRTSSHGPRRGPKGKKNIHMTIAYIEIKSSGMIGLG